MIEIDAANKILGRVASEAAKLLRGKMSANFARNKVPSIKVKIMHAGNLRISEKRRRTKSYTHYSDYPGGLKRQSLEQLMAKKGEAEALRRAVYGMLPANKLRSRLMKNLRIEK